ncbi:MAG: MarR family transcriptional regulator [Chloroflexota bacterium]|nr:MarR family transcriptional regulator [Chloroflexota bacterium]
MQSTAHEGLLGGASMVRLRRAWLREMGRLLLVELGDLSLAQAAALFYVESEEEATVHEVAGAIHRSLSATSRVVDGLVRLGLLDRREDPSDRRSKRVRLTRLGTGIFERMERHRRERVERFRGLLSSREKRQVEGILERFLDALIGESDGTGDGRGLTPRARGSSTARRRA